MAIDINVSPEQDTTTRTSTTGGRLMSPAAAGALDAEAQANEAEAVAKQGQGDAAALQEAVRADQQDLQAAELRRQRVDLAAEQQYQKDKMDAVVGAAEAAEDAFANHKFHDYWSDKSVGQRIAAGFLLFAGGTGGAYLGQENAAARGLYRAMDQDFEKQKHELNSLHERAKMKRQAIGDLGQQQAHDNAALAVKFAKANEVTAAEMTQRLTEAGVPLKEAETNATVAGLKARAQEKRREALQIYDKTYSNSLVQSEKTGDPSEQRKINENLVYDSKGEPFHQAPTPQAAKDFRDRQRALTDLEKATNELEANYAKGTALNPLGKTARERAGIEKRIVLATKTIGELGALSGPDQGIVSDIQGGKLGSIMADPTGIENLRRLHTNALNTSISQIGARPTAEARGRFSPVPDDLGGAPAQPQAAPAKPQRSTASVPAADLQRMRKAYRKGIHDFDDILRANHVIP